MKQCCGCKQTKEYSEFTVLRRAPDGYHSRCKPCKAEYEKRYRDRNPDTTRANNLMKRGLTISQYDDILEYQGGVCAICKQPETTVRQGKVQSLSVDHCHETMRIRGLLCNACNRALGKFKDDVELLKNAIKYLEEDSYDTPHDCARHPD